MPSPFPGMDPYIEQPARWRGFHTRLISVIVAALQPLLRPNYVAECEERLFVTSVERSIYPDVSILKGKGKRGPRNGGPAVATLDVDQPAVFEFFEEEVRERFVTIIDPAVKNRVVTAIEVLSPDNKQPGEGRKSYLQKRDEYWDAGTNLVEIDLLRDGEPTVRVPAWKTEELRPWHYLVAVTRRKPQRHEVYPIPLQQRLPRVAIPLKAKDPDVPLDIQAVVARCWDDGPYPELLEYDAPPPGALKPEEVKWCVKQLKAAGLRRNNRG